MSILHKLLAQVKRYSTVLRRRNPHLRHWVPMRVVRGAIQAQSYLTQWRAQWLSCDYQTSNTNIYHCCVQKTGSQWLMSLLSDPRTYQFSGLAHYHESRHPDSEPTRPATERVYTRPFPEGTIAGPLYIGYDSYRSIPKRAPYRTFFVMRDPRAMVVSWYFSARRNHVVSKELTPHLYRARQDLQHLSTEEGLCRAIDYLEERGRFAALRSWAEHGPDDDHVTLVRFEALRARDNFGAYRDLFDALDIRMPDAVLRELLDAYSFERLTGRSRTEENTSSHLRGGGASSWQTYFTPVVEAHFHEATAGLPALLGYASPTEDASSTTTSV